MTQQTNTKISEKEMLEALQRSGYLFESEITKLLVKYGFFVESNLTSLDPLTGKNREIDLLAEYDHPFDQEKINNKTVSIARFIFEIKNNNSPLVLLTKYEYSPNSEVYTGLKSRTTIPVGLETVYYSDYFDILFNNHPDKTLFTQYCSFIKKKNDQNKNELMAHHPDMLYAALHKITHYCEEKSEGWTLEGEQTYRDEYYRDFLYLPVLLIKDDLYELEIDEDGLNTLKKVECSRLVFNYHYKQEAKTAIVHVVTKNGLKDFLTEILEAERKVEENILEAKTIYLEKAANKQIKKRN
jgi:hypothetical protein